MSGNQHITVYGIAGNIGGFGSWALDDHCKNIGGFKFGGSAWDHHTYTCKYEIILEEFNLAVASLTTKSPKLIICQISPIWYKIVA